jgi:hypothetical protein
VAVTPEDAAATRRAAGIVAWLKARAAEHDKAAGMAGGVGYPAGQEAAIRARECRKVAEEIVRFWT